MDIPFQYLDILQDTQYPVAWSVNEYPHVMGRHFDIHVGLELGIVLHGQSRRCWEGHDYQTTAGQVWFAGLWEPHGMEICEPGTQHLVLGILPDFLDTPDPYAPCDWLEIFRQNPADRPRCKSEADRKFTLSIARRIIDLMTTQADLDDGIVAGPKTSPGKSQTVLPKYWLVKLRMLLHELLLYFMEKMNEPASTPASRDRFNKRQTLLPALLLFEQNPGEPISLAEAARVSHMSRSKFSELFRQTMGVSFGKYCHRRRLAGAMRDLQATDLKLFAIAQKWGFSDAPHLVRTFKTATDQTPQEYRQQYKDHPPQAGPTSAPHMPKVEVFE